MPRFYFDLVNGKGGRVTDAEGLEFADLEAAKADTLHALGEMASDEMDKETSADLRIEIRDGDGSIVCTATLKAGTDC